MYAAIGEGKVMVERRHFPPFYPFSCAVFALCSGMPGAARTLDLLSVCQSKTSAALSALSDMVLQAPCVATCLERLCHNEVLVLMTLLVSAWCRHPTPCQGLSRGDEEEQQLLGWCSPAVLPAPSSLHCLGSACHQQREMPMSVCPCFFFPQLNELVTPDGDAALVMGTFSHGVCSFWHRVAKYSCAYGPSDTITVSCSAPLRFKKPKERFGNSYIKSRYL